MLHRWGLDGLRRPYQSAFAAGAAFSFESADGYDILYREILKLFEKSLENYL
jgi:hypothetical protein